MQESDDISFFTFFFPSMLGAVGIISGLYVVLWGKSKEARNEMMQAQTTDAVKDAANMDSQLDIENNLSAPLLGGMSDAQQVNQSRHTKTDETVTNNQEIIS